MEKKLKLVEALVIGAVFVAIFITAVTVVAELVVSLKDWLKVTFSHHWIGKSIISAVLFLVLSLLAYLVPRRHSLDRLNSLLLALIVIVAIGALVIFGFFTYETVLK